MSLILSRNGLETAAQVAAVDVLLWKELQVSTVCRLGITYRGPVDESYPRSLFLKLPRALGDGSRVPGADDHAEVEFYTKAAQQIGSPPLIRCYDAAYSRETKRSHLLLEDLTRTHSQPKQNDAPAVAISRTAVRALAKSHAAWWNRAIPDSGSEVSGAGLVLRSNFDDKMLGTFIENLNKSVAEFQQTVQLIDRQKEAYRLMVDAAPQIWGRMVRRDHVTVTHGDMHWWNFLYPKDPKVHSVRLFDWHLWHIDLGARDLAFLLALGGFAEPRPEIEEELLLVYHETLIESGVAGYSWEMLIEDYRWSAIRNLNIPLIFWSQGKHYSTWQTALRRAFESFNRLNCNDLLSG